MSTATRVHAQEGIGYAQQAQPQGREEKQQEFKTLGHYKTLEIVAVESSEISLAEKQKVSVLLYARRGF